MKAAETNRAFYGQAAEGTNDYWDLMAAPRWRVTTLRTLLARDRPRAVVDLGCGNGALLEAVRSAVPDAALMGLDLSAEQIDRNRREKPGLQWRVADLSGPPSALPEGTAGRFDAVLATELIEHLDRPDAFLALARALARPGARLYLTTQSGPVHETERRVGHVRHFTADGLGRLLQAAGWRTERVWNGGFPFHDLSKKIANLNPDAMMQRFAGQKYGWKERLTCAVLRGAFRLNSQHRGYQLFAVAQNPA